MYHVGTREMRITDLDGNITFPALVMYPTNVPSTPVMFGPYAIETSPDAPVAKGRYPLVVVSHGNGGWHLLYRSITTHLARNGYVVAMLEHAGNNRNDNSLEGTHANLVNRPKHLSLTIDAVIGDAELGACVMPECVGVIGHSIGGYTALAVAGGAPWSERREPVEVVPDARVRGLVLLAPATAWYTPEGSLRDVNLPILMLIAEHDPYTPRWQAEIVLNGVADRDLVTLRVVPNAGHFSFLSPFPAAMRVPGFLPATDPAGFDREKFHEELPGEVLEFLERRLKGIEAVHYSS